MSSPMGNEEGVPTKDPEFMTDRMSIDTSEGLNIEKHELTGERSLQFRKSTLDLICLTLGLGGLQGVFALQFGNGSEYLTSLGLSKPVMSLVWLAGPISGAILQPYFCLRSDQCQSRWGRRKPFVVGGGGAIILSLLGQAWAPDLMRSTTYLLLGVDRQSILSTEIVATTVVLFVVALNFAVQPVQGCLRALIVDTCPKDQQATANAWAGRIISIANVLSYFCGYIDLASLFPALGGTQFKVLSSVTSVALGVSIAMTCWTVKERPGAWHEPDIDSSRNLLHELGYLAKRYRDLPLQVQRVCIIQVFAWMGWFPFLFYVELYIRDRYLTTSLDYSAPSNSFTEEEAAKRGLLGMVIFAAISLFASIAVPTLVRPNNHSQHHHSRSPLLSNLLITISTWISSIHHLWMVSHMLYAICMLATMFISSISGTYALVGIAGVCWAVTIWAPYAIISTSLLDSTDIHQNDDGAGSEQRLGTVIGIHNVAIAVPQILAALLCSFVFWMFDGSGSSLTDDSIGWVLRLGGLSALAAAILTTRLNEDGEIERCKLEEMQYA
ncbi:MFS general substrate transporter-30 [Coleophoma crateriformis]|uniref:MFS general substrate transporter-30 n=1 Tax=Coleophoma crateriformis TaxID=565419 RepID=A0A3D8Q871_9HELO|nr:MFS general substrate transporter-30 [Coleophoma crateriformis]